MFLRLLPSRPVRHRLLALLCAGVLALLGVLAVQPELHEAICHHEAAAAPDHPADAGGSDGCIVTQFAAGQVLFFLAAGWLCLDLLRAVVRRPEPVEMPAVLSVAYPVACGPPAA